MLNLLENASQATSSFRCGERALPKALELDWETHYIFDSFESFILVDLRVEFLILSLIQLFWLKPLLVAWVEMESVP